MDLSQSKKSKDEIYCGFLISTFSPNKEKYAVRDGYKILR